MGINNDNTNKNKIKQKTTQNKTKTIFFSAYLRLDHESRPTPGSPSDS